MAYNFYSRARKLAWSTHDDKTTLGITQIRRVGTDNTLVDEDETDVSSTSVKRLQISSNMSAFMSALKRDGFVIIENFTDLSSLQKAATEAKLWLKDEESGSSIPLIRQSPSIRNTFYANEVYQDLCEEFLTMEVIRRKNGQLTSQLCQPVFSSATARKLKHSTEVDHELSRHDAALGTRHEHVHKYQHGRDSMVGLLIPSSETIQFHVAPGSHLKGNEQPNLIVLEEELKPGEAAIVLGSLYHYVAAQTQQSQAHAEPVLVHALWSSAGVYRSEEPAASMVTAAELRTYPDVVQDRLR